MNAPEPRDAGGTTRRGPRRLWWVERQEQTLNSRFAAASSSVPTALAAKLRAAERPRLRDFPFPNRRSLRALAQTLKPGPQVGLAGSVLLPGVNRVAFGLIGQDQKFVYGPSALYVARSPSGRARGPFLAPADSFVPDRAYLSKTAAADTADIKAIYATQVHFARAGRYAVLAVSRVNGKLVGAASQVEVRRSSPIPGVGERPPRVSTDTVARAKGNVGAIDTRVPHDDMHRVDFRDVIGKRPVVLLFSTPQLCQSRVCGPVTDLELELEHTYGKRVAFIHQEVYRDNEIKKGLRTPLKAFHLETEPWVFAFQPQRPRGRTSGRSVRHQCVPVRRRGRVALRADPIGLAGRQLLVRPVADDDALAVTELETREARRSPAVDPHAQPVCACGAEWSKVLGRECEAPDGEELWLLATWCGLRGS